MEKILNELPFLAPGGSCSDLRGAILDVRWLTSEGHEVASLRGCALNKNSNPKALLSPGLFHFRGNKPRAFIYLKWPVFFVLF